MKTECTTLRNTINQLSISAGSL